MQGREIFPPRKPLISRETGKEFRSTVRFVDSRPGMRAESAAATSAARIPVHPDAARRRQDRLRPSRRGGMGEPALGALRVGGVTGARRRATERRENFPTCRPLKSRETRKSLPCPLRPAPPRPMLLPGGSVGRPQPRIGGERSPSDARPSHRLPPRIDKLPPFGLPARRQSKTPSGRVRRGVSHSGAEGATAPETLRPMDRWVMTLWKAVAARCASAHRRG